MIQLIHYTIQQSIICTDLTCYANVTVDLTSISQTLNFKMPVNPCATITVDPVTQAILTGIAFDDQRYCSALYTSSIKQLQLNLSFDGKGWNYKYFVDTLSSTTEFKFSIQLTDGAATENKTVSLTLPQSPSFGQFCQIIENDKYSAIVQGNGLCMPLVTQIQIDSSGSITFQGKSCFNQNLQQTFLQNQISKPTMQMSQTTQQNPSTLTQTILVGVFNMIYNVKILVEINGTNVSYIPVLQNYPSLSNQILLQQFSKGKYPFYVQYQDLCGTWYNSTKNQLYVLDYKDFAINSNITCDNSTNLCSQQFTIPNLFSFSTATYICQSISFNNIDMSQYKCSFDGATSVLSIIFKPSFNLTFMFTESSAYTIDMSAYTRRNETSLDYLSTLTLGTQNIDMKAQFDYSKLYCQFTTYTDLATAIDTKVSLNKFQCGNKVQITPNTFDATEEAKSTQTVTISYSSCFKQNISESKTIIKTPFNVIPLTQPIEISQNDTFNLSVQIIDPSVFVAATQGVLVYGAITINSQSSSTDSSGTYPVITYQFKLNSTGTYTFKLLQLLDRCTQTATATFIQSLGTITVLAYQFIEPNSYSTCDVLGNYSQYVLATQETFVYTYAAFCSKLSNTDKLSSLPCATYFQTQYDTEFSDSKCQCVVDDFVVTLKGNFRVHTSTSTNTTNSLCFTHYINRTCLLIPEPALPCTNQYYTYLTLCNATSAAPVSLIQSNVSTFSTTTPVKTVSIQSTTRFSQSITKQLVSNETVLVNVISVQTVYNCTVTCDQTANISLSLTVASGLTISRVYLQNDVYPTQFELLYLSGSIYQRVYSDIQSVGSFTLLIDYVNSCGAAQTITSTVKTQIVRNCTYAIKDEYITLNSFIFYNLIPTGFVFQYVTGTSISLTRATGSVSYPGVVSTSMKSIEFIIRGTCTFTLNINDLNKTIYAVSSDTCDFTTTEKDLLTQKFSLQLRATIGTSPLSFNSPTIQVLIIDSRLDLENKCKLAAAMIANSPPAYYYAQYSYFAKCDNVPTLQLKVNEKTANDVLISGSGQTFTIVGCNQNRSCAETVITVTSTSILQQDTSLQFDSYSDYFNLPLFQKQNLVKAAYYNQLDTTKRTPFISYLFSRYTYCVNNNISNCHQGSDFPYITESYYLASFNTKIQQLILSDYFSSEQLKYVRSAAGLMGSEYISNLQKFTQLNQLSDPNILQQHLQQIQAHAQTDIGVQIGFNGQWTFKALNTTYIFDIADMFNCKEYITYEVNLLKIQIRTGYSDIFGCANRIGYCNIIGINSYNSSMFIQAFGGGDTLQAQFNSTQVPCWKGATMTNTTNITCKQSFSQTFNQSYLYSTSTTNTTTNKLSKGQIAGIVIGSIVGFALIIVGIIYLVKNVNFVPRTNSLKALSV
ncbi:Conserved_hypothetical protein [Hexamita inflata]|uniref:Transmembrane protein n=1 Tax=Hexamita inflata TaxID=28002 RepID=A0ABP1HRC6_9EUKA